MQRTVLLAFFSVPLSLHRDFIQNTTTLQCNRVCGDVNGDGKADVADITRTVNFVQGRAEPSLCDLLQAGHTGDKRITQIDLDRMQQLGSSCRFTSVF